ncbi:anti-sigma factor [Sphingomonas baiyangensis]|uniref:Anti-sigma K factor RskA C-terminal domain-containing protein n=1 Tax=Sphingomonas baiyangensis TaxID=2572576 RepID=A0A4U1L4S9_9SPHN|nr:anti-sigma factor [Sphingomonas baiyangensis]TKD51250.1 hypothetical protein FBR43_11160 [Sphingomonas baiyangensis]
MADPAGPDDRDLLAAELALGLLDSDERADAEALIAGDAAFARDHARWEQRLAMLFDEVEEAVPGASVWERIDARIAPAAVPAPPANDDMPAHDPARKWKIATGAFGSLAAGLALALVLQPEPPPPAPPRVVIQTPDDVIVAQLQGSDGASILALRLDPVGERLLVRATAIPDGAGEPELWVIPDGGAPRSLGLVARDGETSVRLGGDLGRLLRDGNTLALTLEPASGAPHAAPSGDILATTRLTQL